MKKTPNWRNYRDDTLLTVYFSVRIQQRVQADTAATNRDNKTVICCLFFIPKIHKIILHEKNDILETKFDAVNTPNAIEVYDKIPHFNSPSGDKYQ
jgi:hypothetical protein